MGFPLIFRGTSPESAERISLESADGRVQVEFTKADEGFFETIGTPFGGGGDSRPRDDDRRSW